MPAGKSRSCDVEAGTGVRLTMHADGVEVTTAAYRWEWRRDDDLIALRGPDATLIVSAPLAPVVEVAGAPTSPARCRGVSRDGRCLHLAYDVNDGGTLDLRVTFHARHVVLDRLTYHPSGTEAVVRVTFGARAIGGAAVPAVRADTCVIPGGRAAPERAVFRSEELAGRRFSIGYSELAGDPAAQDPAAQDPAAQDPAARQQWGLPHYLVCAYTEPAGAARSHAACIGLGGLPDGLASVMSGGGAFGLDVEIRGEIWGHRRGPGPVHFEWPILIAVAAGWYEAGRAYIEALHAEGYAEPKRPQATPSTAGLAQYDTWGDQLVRGAFFSLLDEAHLRAIHADLRRSGMRPDVFVIDDKWEDVYGTLRHDAARFPRFLEFLEQVRADGMGIGLWTAFPRCEDFASLGLTERSVLRTPEGTPYVHRHMGRSWCIFDPSDAAARHHGLPPPDALRMPSRLDSTLPITLAPSSSSRDHSCTLETFQVLELSSCLNLSISNANLASHHPL